MLKLVFSKIEFSKKWLAIATIVGVFVCWGNISPAEAVSLTNTTRTTNQINTTNTGNTTAGKVSSVSLRNLTVSPNPFTHADSKNLSISYDIDTSGKDLYVTLEVLNSAKTKTLYSRSSKINKTGNNLTLWDGKDNSQNIVSAGSYIVKASLSNSNPLAVVSRLNNPLTVYKSLERSLTINAVSSLTESETGTISEASSSEGSGSSSSESISNNSDNSESSPSSGSSSTSSDENVSTDSGNTAEVSLMPSPLDLRCTPQAKILYFENSEPAYDRIFVNCTINLPSLVKASIYSKAYDPAAPDNSANLIKVVTLETSQKKGAFKFGWDGYDEYDRPVALDDYTFVVEGKIDDLHKTKISAKTFKVSNVPTDAETAASDVSSDTSDSSDVLREAAPEAAKPGLLDQVSAVIFGNEQAITDGAASSDAEAAAAQLPRELSKCPNVYYPIDISGSPYESLIKKAYDECLVSGYPDGSFRHQQFVSRPEMIKMVVLASGNVAKQGCYDADCGSPFNDLEMWMGPWVRAAWDKGFVSGLAPDTLGTATITRAEAVALVVKAFGIGVYQGCYSANCGAGYPDNLFTDIIYNWEGPYLRAAWDKGIINTLTPGKFYPENPMTRAQVLELVMQAKSLK